MTDAEMRDGAPAVDTTVGGRPRERALERVASVRSRFILPIIARRLLGWETRHAYGGALEPLPPSGTRSY